MKTPYWVWEWFGWMGSLVVHVAIALVLFLVRGAFSSSSMIVMGFPGGGTGGPMRIDLVSPEEAGGVLPPEPAVPRSIRKYTPEPEPLPPEPEDLPEPEPRTKPDDRPKVAPNVRAKKRVQPPAPTPSPVRSTDVHAPVRFGLSGGRGGGQGSGIGTGIGPGTGQGAFPYQDYLLAVRTRIQTFWRPLIAPRGPAQTYVARVFFTIDRSGRLVTLRITRSSGEPLYDMSIERAIRLAAPFPPLPAGYSGRTLSFDIEFRYQP